MGARAESETSAGGADPGVAWLRNRLPALVLAAFGLGLLAVATWNYLREQHALAVDTPPLAAAGIGVVLAVGLLFASVRLARSGFDRAERWRVAGITIAGGAMFAGVIGLTMVVRAAEGRPISEAPFVLFTAAGGGGVAGVLVGTLYARARRDAREAEVAHETAEYARAEAETAKNDLERAKERAEAAREETEELLERARRTRDDLTLINSVLRHDIKNNVMVIQSRVEFLLDSVRDAESTGELDDRAEEFLDTVAAQVDEIERQVERTGAVIETLAEEEPDLQETDLRAALTDQVETLRDSFEVDVSVDWSGEADLEVLANQILPAVLGNVLTNAVAHHGGDRPTIEVSVTTTDDTVTVRVADDGPGIADDRKDEVFHRGASSGEGGFGLFFVERMMTEYGGDIHVEDSDLGGAAFVYEFQRA